MLVELHEVEMQVLYPILIQNVLLKQTRQVQVSFARLEETHIIQTWLTYVQHWFLFVLWNTSKWIAKCIDLLYQSLLLILGASRISAFSLLLQHFKHVIQRPYLPLVLWVLCVIGIHHISWVCNDNILLRHSLRCESLMTLLRYLLFHLLIPCLLRLGIRSWVVIWQQWFRRMFPDYNLPLLTVIVKL